MVVDVDVVVEVVVGFGVVVVVVVCVVVGVVVGLDVVVVGDVVVLEVVGMGVVVAVVLVIVVGNGFVVETVVCELVVVLSCFIVVGEVRSELVASVCTIGVDVVVGTKTNDFPFIYIFTYICMYDLFLRSVLQTIYEIKILAMSACNNN